MWEWSRGAPQTQQLLLQCGPNVSAPPLPRGFAGTIDKFHRQKKSFKLTWQLVSIMSSTPVPTHGSPEEPLSPRPDSRVSEPRRREPLSPPGHDPLPLMQFKADPRPLAPSPGELVLTKAAELHKSSTDLHCHRIPRIPPLDGAEERGIIHLTRFHRL